MRYLGLEWYGGLMDHMQAHNINMTPLSDDVVATMQASIDKAFYGYSA